MPTRSASVTSALTTAPTGYLVSIDSSRGPIGGFSVVSTDSSYALGIVEDGGHRDYDGYLIALQVLRDAGATRGMKALPPSLGRRGVVLGVGGASEQVGVFYMSRQGGFRGSTESIGPAFSTSDYVAYRGADFVRRFWSAWGDK